MGNASAHAVSPLASLAALSTRCTRERVVRFPGAVDAATCGAIVDAVYRARPRWTPNFSGVQFTLGRAWYTHFEEDREDAYFEGAAESDAGVEDAVPGFQELVLRVVAERMGAPVARRPGWCGPGVHIFPAGSQVARRGGEVHFDTEGMSDAQLEAGTPSLSFVLMLQMPELGGGLRVWDAFYAGEDFPDHPGPRVASTTVAYTPGELVAFDAYRLHQILSFRGERDRVSATVHLLLEGGVWQAWF
jgi:hypothetical protein